jgi:hypothetical protein
MQGDHVDMVKFSNKADQNYIELEKEIINMVSKRVVPDFSKLQHEVQPATFTASSRSNTLNIPLRVTNLTGQGLSESPRPNSMDFSRPLRASTINTVQTSSNSFGPSLNQLGIINEGLSAPLASFQPSIKRHRHTSSQESFHSSQRLSADLSAMPDFPLPSQGNLLEKLDRITLPRDYDKDGSDFARLEMFDTTLIIDDTSSMAVPVDSEAAAKERVTLRAQLTRERSQLITRWELLETAVLHLVTIATNWDDDGIDIQFLKTQSLDEKRITDPKVIASKLEAIRPLLETKRCGGGTRIEPQLKKVIDPRLKMLQEYHRGIAAHETRTEPKKLNLIIFTDGKASDDDEVEDYIVKVATKLDKMEASRRAIGIQFVQVGDDKNAAKWLRHLDNHLKNQKGQAVRDVS